MRYLTVIGLLIALGLVVSLGAMMYLRTPAGPNYNAATGAAKRATGAAEQHVTQVQRVQDVLKNVGAGR